MFQFVCGKRQLFYFFFFFLEKIECSYICKLDIFFKYNVTFVQTLFQLFQLDKKIFLFIRRLFVQIISNKRQQYMKM